MVIALVRSAQRDFRFGVATVTIAALRMPTNAIFSVSDHPPRRTLLPFQ